MLGAELCLSRIHMVKPSLPGPQNWTGFGDSLPREGKVQWGHRGGPYSSLTGVLVRRGGLDTNIQREDRVGMQGEDDCLQAKERYLRRKDSADTLILDF